MPTIKMLLGGKSIPPKKQKHGIYGQVIRHKVILCICGKTYAPGDGSVCDHAAKLRQNAERTWYN